MQVYPANPETTVTSNLYYEQPLNERIRTFLRLEKLFHQFAFHVKQGSEWNHPIAIESIIDLISFTTRSDIKLETMKELERQHAALGRLVKRPQIDQQQLGALLKNIEERIKDLKSSNGQLGQELLQVELLSSIRQKNSLPGCICSFDLPVYTFWLSQPEQVRRQHLEQWFAPFAILDRSVQLILDVLRHSVEDTDEVAVNGFFQMAIETNKVAQLLRIAVPDNTDCYPEISAGKHRFSVRFMSNKNPSSRPEQYQKDINFKLGMCAF